jgi:hypothetical protein
MAFQALYPLASIRYISSLPDFLINEGHLILQAQLRLRPQEAAELLLLPFLTHRSSIVTSPVVLGGLSGSVRMPPPIPCWSLDLVGTYLLRLPRPPILLPPVVRPPTVSPPSLSLVIMATGLAARHRHSSDLTPTASTTPASRLMGGRARFMGDPSVVMGGFPPDLPATLTLVSPASTTYHR